MVSFPSPQNYIFNTFKGIRTRNGIASGGVISATVCQNIDFAPSSYDAGVQIRTTLGNVAVYELEGFNIIRGFETVQEGVRHLLFYVENDTKGQLIEYNLSTKETTVLADNLTRTQKANGIPIKSLAYDIFVFTNGVEYYTVKLYPSTTVTRIYPAITIDGVTTNLTGLALAEQSGSLVVGSNEGYVLASRKDDITVFNDYATATDSNKSWYQIFGKPITAIVSYTGGLLVFTEDDNTVLSGNFSLGLEGGASRKDASLGGCMSYESFVKHDKYLFFYDNRQKNVYYYTQNDYGQMVLGQPVAPEVQMFFNDLSKVQMVSYVGENRSEIWFLTDKNKLIYDYYINEWSERVCQDLTSYFVYDNAVYSTGGSKCFKEKTGNICTFDGEYMPAVYTTQIINLGSFSNMKEMEFQPLISVTTDYNNSFYIDCLIDGKKTKSKHVQMYLQGAIWGDENEETTNDNELWDVQVFPDESSAVIQQVKGKFISNWYYLQFTIRTENEGEDFSITCFELKGITQETDTIGRK